MFENPQLAIGDLPSMADIDWQPLHKSLIKQQLVVRGAVVFVMFAVSLASELIPGVVISPLWFVLPLVGVISIALLAWPFIAVPRKGVATRAMDIAYRHGVFWRTVTAIPFNRIQHVETSHGPLDRRFGTASLQVFTAGGSSGDLEINGLEAGEAERLRGFILAKIGGQLEQG